MYNADFYLLVKFWAQASMMKQCFCQNNNSILLAELFQHLTYMIIAKIMYPNLVSKWPSHPGC